MASQAGKTPITPSESVESLESMEFETGEETGEESRGKRKGSPLSKEEVKKLSTLITEKPKALRRQNSLPNIAKAATSKGKGTKMAFSDMVKITFSDPAFAKSMAPIMHDMLYPLIQETITATVNATTANIQTTIVDKMVESNGELQRLVTEQTGIINSQKTIITEQKQLIDEQNELLESKSSRIEQLECDVEYLMLEMESLKGSINNLEQYGRRSSVRINNFKPMGPPGDENGLSDSVRKFLNDTVLKDVRPLEARDLERCHFVGQAKTGRPRQIIVKFAHYQDKKRVFAAKSLLKANPDKVFLTEDLTSANHAVVKQLLPLKKNAKINSFWTVNGQIYVKKTALSDPVKISYMDSVSSKLSI